MKSVCFDLFSVLFVNVYAGGLKVIPLLAVNFPASAVAVEQALLSRWAICKHDGQNGGEITEREGLGL